MAYKRSDFDGEPGSSTMSKGYARLYDPQGESEYSNLPENANQLDVAFYKQDLENAMDRLRTERSKAAGRIQLWPNVGKFIIPRENTFAAHMELVKGGRGISLQFGEGYYPYFDKIIAERAKRPDLFDPSHPDYAKNENARNNLAVLRNDLMGFYMQDESFDPGDEKFIPLLTGIATEIGNALRNEKQALGQVFGPTLNTQMLNMEGDGAAYVYRMLRKQQRNPIAFGARVMRDVRRSFGIGTKEWGLPPIEMTAFSDAGLDALPPVDYLSMTPQEQQNYARAMLEANSVKQNVDTLSGEDKRESVLHGHIILDWLRNLKLTKEGVKEVVDTGAPQAREELRATLERALDAYDDYLERALAHNPALANSHAVMAADEAANVLEHSIEILAKLEKPISAAQTMSISSDLSQQPENLDKLSQDIVDSLLAVKGGLEHTVSALEQQAADMERGDEQVSEQSAESQLNEQQRRRRRRRRQQQVKTSTAQAKRRNAGDLNGDGVLDSEQGLLKNTKQPISLREAPETQAQLEQNLPPQARDVQMDKLLNLKDTDFAAVRDAARMLAKSANEVNGLQTAEQALAEVNANDKLKADDQSMAQQQQQRRDNNPSEVTRGGTRRRRDNGNGNGNGNGNSGGSGGGRR